MTSLLEKLKRFATKNESALESGAKSVISGDKNWASALQDFFTSSQGGGETGNNTETANLTPPIPTATLVVGAIVVVALILYSRK